MHPLPVLLTPFPFITSTEEEIIGCTNKAAKFANKNPRNPLSYFFIVCFTV